ncbi:unnamed protein product, partial [Prorocentrum cordatum]
VGVAPGGDTGADVGSTLEPEVVVENSGVDDVVDVPSGEGPQSEEHAVRLRVEGDAAPVDAEAPGAAAIPPAGPLRGVTSTDAVETGAGARGGSAGADVGALLRGLRTAMAAATPAPTDAER